MPPAKRSGQKLLSNGTCLCAGLDNYFTAYCLTGCWDGGEGEGGGRGERAVAARYHPAPKGRGRERDALLSRSSLPNFSREFIYIRMHIYAYMCVYIYPSIDTEKGFLQIHRSFTFPFSSLSHRGHPPLAAVAARVAEGALQLLGVNKRGRRKPACMG